MGLEEFIRDSKPRASIKRRKDIREYIQNQRMVNHRTEDVSTMSPPVKAVYVRNVPDAVDDWMEAHSEKKYVKSKHIASDVDIKRSDIAVALNHMNIECWSNSPGTGAIYVNPYFSADQD